MNLRLSDFVLVADQFRTTRHCLVAPDQPDSCSFLGHQALPARQVLFHDRRLPARDSQSDRFMQLASLNAWL